MQQLPQLCCLSEKQIHKLHTTTKYPVPQDLLLSRPCIINFDFRPLFSNFPRLVHNHINDLPHPLHLLFHHPSTTCTRKVHRITHVYRDRQPFSQDLGDACCIFECLFADVKGCGKRWARGASSLLFPPSLESIGKKQQITKDEMYVGESIDKTAQSCLL